MAGSVDAKEYKMFIGHIPDAVKGVYLAEPIAVCTTAPMFYLYYRKMC